MPEALEVRQSDISGKGVYTNRSFHEGEIVYQLKGTPFDYDTIMSLIAEGKLHKDDPFQVDERAYLVLDDFSRTFNHSCDPNSGVGKASRLIALREIFVDEEITFDYSTTVGLNIPSTFWSMPCCCGSAICRGVLGNVGTIPTKRLNFYINRNCLPKF